MPSLKQLVFPQHTRDLWTRHAATVTEDPYTLYASIAPKLAAVLLEILDATAKNGPSEEQRTHAAWLLEEIHAQKAGKGAGAFLVTNFPIDDVSRVPTPIIPGYFGTNGKGLLSEISQLAFTTALGLNPITHPQISGGNPFQHITPRLGRKDDKGNAGTVEFGPHTEGAFRTADEVPDVLSLLGIRNYSRTPTDVYPLDQLLNPRYLSETDIRALYEDNFIYRSGDALNKGDEMTHTGPAIITVEGRNQWRVRAVPGAWEGTTARSKNAVNKLMHTLNAPAEYPELNASPVVMPATLLYLNNHENAHGRPAIISEMGQVMDLNTMSAEAQALARHLQRMQLRAARSGEMGSAKL